MFEERGSGEKHVFEGRQVLSESPYQQNEICLQFVIVRFCKILFGFATIMYFYEIRFSGYHAKIYRNINGLYFI